MDIVQKIKIEADPVLDERHETAVEMWVHTGNGNTYHKRIDIAAGFPPRSLTRDEIIERFWNCIEYANKPLPRKNVEKLLSLVNSMENVEDVRSLIPLFVW